MSRTPTMHRPPKGATFKPLEPVQRLKMARGLLDETVNATGAGYLLIMWLPGTDLILRSLHGLDTPAECGALAMEVKAMLSAQVKTLNEAASQPKPNGG